MAPAYGRFEGRELHKASALVSEALADWLARRRVAALNTAYAHLASLEAADLQAAAEAAVAMGLEGPAGTVVSRDLHCPVNPSASRMAPRRLPVRGTRSSAS
jgi:hypothetical protein